MDQLPQLAVIDVEMENTYGLTKALISVQFSYYYLLYLLDGSCVCMTYDDHGNRQNECYNYIICSIKNIVKKAILMSKNVFAYIHIHL